MHDLNLIIARNPANEMDACWFTFEEEAYEHFCDYGDDYIYTAFNDAEGWSVPMNGDFADRQNEARSACRFDREASRADFQNDERAELVR